MQMFHPPHTHTHTISHNSLWTEKSITLPSSPVQVLAPLHWYKRGLRKRDWWRQAGWQQCQGSWSRGAWARRDLITTAPWCPLSYQALGLSKAYQHRETLAQLGLCRFPSPRGKCSVMTFKWLASPWLKSQLIKAKLPSMVQRSGGSDEVSADRALLARQGSPLCMYHPYLPQALSYRAFFQVEIPEGQTSMFWIIQPVSAFLSEGSAPCQQTHL